MLFNLKPIFGALLIALLCSTNPAFANHLLVTKAWLEDDSGRMTLKDAERARYQGFTASLSRGYGSTPIWIKISIDPTADEHTAQEAGDPRYFYLRIGESYLDDIQIFDPTFNGERPIMAGDQHPLPANALRSTVFLLPIPKGTARRDLYVRVSSISSRHIFVQVLSGIEARHSESTARDFSIAYLAAIGTLLAWGIFSLALYCDRLVAAFVATLAADIATIMFRTGLARYFWPQALSPKWFDLGTPFFISLSTAIGVVFYLELLRGYAIPNGYRTALKAFVPIFLLEVIAMAFGHPDIMIRLIPVKVLLVNLICVVAIARSRQDQSSEHLLLLPKKWLLYYFLVLLGVVTAGVAALYGLVGQVPVSPSIAATHSFLAAFVLMAMLQYRAIATAKQQQALATELRLSRAATERERAYNEERERLFDMITHEFKTALAVIQMRLHAGTPGAREIGAAVDDIKILVERCAQADRMDAGGLVPQLEVCAVRPLIDTVVARHADPRIRIDTDQAVTEITTDPQLLAIAIGNLLENAIKYGAPQSPIDVRITTSIEQGHRMIDIGISNAIGTTGWPDRNAIFQRYHRGPRAKRLSGSGLGLYIVAGIAKMLGGEAQYEPTDTLAVFSIRLPMSDNSAQQ